MHTDSARANHMATCKSISDMIAIDGLHRACFASRLKTAAALSFGEAGLNAHVFGLRGTRSGHPSLGVGVAGRL